MVGLISASDTYNRKNQNMTIEANLDAVADMAEVAQRERIPLVMAIAIAMFCPYEGEIPGVARARADRADARRWCGGILASQRVSASTARPRSTACARRSSTAGPG